ncbi:hypothetical protein DYB32_007522 [Aphanomyces invadans]|uniref:Uncharacterized protein n=1 Tax=Aphanomyces invadans TaxID=157072 RepID=A0A418ANV2_9STRA|nr:hypothetical protein DYB32_007522 [Aphanomyces invadans]
MEDDTNLRHSPRTLSRQLMAAVEYQESLHEAQMNLSALEYAHEMERHQNETLLWGHSIQEEVDSMAQAQKLLDQHMQMQEDFHQQELVLQALGHTAQERDNVAEQACQTDELVQQHVATMAQWTVEMGTMAVECRDGFVQCILQHSVAIQSDEADVQAWETHLIDPSSPKDVAVAPAAPQPAELDCTRPTQFHLAIEKSPYSSAAHSVEAYSETFETSSPKKFAPPPSNANVAASHESMDDAWYSQAFDSSTKEASCSDVASDKEDEDDGSGSAASLNAPVASESEENIVDEHDSPEGTSNPDEPDIDAASEDASGWPQSIGNVVESEEYSEVFDSPPKPTSVYPTHGNIPDEVEVGHINERSDTAAERSATDVPREDEVDEVEESTNSSRSKNDSIASDFEGDANSVADEIAAPSIPNDSVKGEENYSDVFESPRSKPSSSPRCRRDGVSDSNPLEPAVVRRIATVAAPPMVPLPLASGTGKAPQQRVEAYLSHLRETDPEKEEYIRSILARKASEDKILDMRQRSLATRRNISRMQYQAERMQLDSCRAANLARCYEDMILFRQVEVEDPDEIDILALAFGQPSVGLGIVALHPNKFNYHTAVDLSDQRQPPLPVANANQLDPGRDEGDDADDAKNTSGHDESVSAEEDYDEDEFEETSSKTVNEQDDDIQDDGEGSHGASAVSVVEIVPASEAKLDSLRQSDANEYSFDDFASTKDNDDTSMADRDDNAPDGFEVDSVVTDAVAAVPDAESYDDGFDEDSMNDFVVKQSEDGPTVVEEEAEARATGEKSVDMPSVDDFNGNGVEDDEDGDASTSVEKGIAVAAGEVTDNHDGKEVDDDDYSMNDFNSTSIAIPPDAAESAPKLECGGDAPSSEDEDVVNGQQGGETNDSIADEASEEDGGGAADMYAMDEFASGATLGSTLVPPRDSVDEYGSNEFENSDHGDATTCVTNDLAEISIERDVNAAERDSNTSQELKLALEKIAIEYPVKIGQDKAKWQRRKDQAMALVEAKERAIAQLKFKAEVKHINELVAYSLSLNVEDEANRSAPTPLVPSTSVPVVANAPAHHVTLPLVVEKAETAEEYSDSFENRSDGDAAYSDDAFEDDAVVDEPESTKGEDPPVVEAEPLAMPQRNDDPATAPPVELESSLSRSIDEHEQRLAELKVILLSGPHAGKLCVVPPMVAQLDQAERLVATTQSRLSDLQRHRQDSTLLAAAATAPSHDKHPHESSFEMAEHDDCGISPDTPMELGDTHDPNASCSDSFSTAASREERAASSAVDDGVAGKVVGVTMNSLGASVEISIVDGDSISDDFDDDQSFASGDDAAMTIHSPDWEIQDQLGEPTSPNTFDMDLAEPRTVLPIPTVLDDSFTSVDDNLTSPDLLSGYDLVEAAAPSNWMHEVATQTIPDPLESLSEFDYVEAAELVQPPTDATVALKIPDHSLDKTLDLLALYDVVEDVQGPAEVGFVTQWELEYQSLLAGYDHVEEAHPPVTAALNTIQEEDAEKPSASNNTVDLLRGYDIVEDVEQVYILDEAPDSGSLDRAEHTSPAKSTAVHCHFDEGGVHDVVPVYGIDHADNAQAEEVVPLQQQGVDRSIRTSSVQELEHMKCQAVPHSTVRADDLLAPFDYIEEAVAATVRRALSPCTDVLSSFDYVEDAWMPGTSTTRPSSVNAPNPSASTSHGRNPSLNVQVDHITNCLWGEVLDDVLSTTDFSLACSTITTADDSTPHFQPSMDAMTPGAPMAEAALMAPPQIPTAVDRTESSVDVVTDGLMHELLQESLTFYCSQRKFCPQPTPARPLNQASPPTPYHRDIATAPPDAALRNVTHFPDEYTTLMQSRKPYDWTHVDEILLRKIKNGEAESNSTQLSTAGDSVVSGGAIKDRRRLLKEWTTIKRPSARGRHAPSPAAPTLAPLTVKDLYLATQETKSVAALVQSLVKEAVSEVADSNDAIVDAVVESLLDDTAAEVASTASRLALAADGVAGHAAPLS